MQGLRATAAAMAVGALTLASTASGGGGFVEDADSAPDPPLAPFATLALAAPGGTIEAVLYDGNQLAVNSSVTTTMTGFTAPPAPLRAQTTYIVLDGQCGPGAPNGCAGVQTAGSGDLLSFGAGPVSGTSGPDAFKGSDGCPWGQDTCLWDTRTLDVSNLTAPGATAATATVTSAPGTDGTDCINHVAQVFAVGPADAWTHAGYVAGGVGLRNRGAGTISIAGIPAGATVTRALLYWAILSPANPGGSMTFAGNAASGALVAAGGDPCWGASASWAFRADVTAFVTGNGSYTVAGFPTGSVSGSNPWSFPSPTPMMEGASLVVFFESGARTFEISLSSFIPHDNVVGGPFDRCIPGRQLYFAGDDRGFSATATSFRTRHVVTVVPEVSGDADGDGIADGTTPLPLVGETRSYTIEALLDNGRIGPEDDDGVLGDCFLLHGSGTASTGNMRVLVTRTGDHSVRARIFGGASNPLSFAAPAIDWDVTVTIDTSTGTPQWTLTGAHDGFPAFELYVEGTALHLYDPGAPPYTFFGHVRKLFPPLDVTVSGSGELP